MDIVKTKSFELAVLSRGDKNSSKLAILLPGRLDTKDYINFVSHAEYLASRGFFALSFDPPGTWESLGGIELYTTTNYIKAVNELIEHFSNRQTLLIGHSRGAAVAILASMANPAIIGIIPIMPNLGAPTAPEKENIKKGFFRSYRDMPPGTSKTVEQKEFNLPITYWTDGQKYNPTDALKKCTKPKLLVYGTDDEFTPVEVVKKSFEFVPEPKMIKEVASDHDYRYHPEVIREIEEEIGRFIDRYLS